ncbi:PP2C family protein-serine/threonine phosphatase [Flammeovirga agarivorans]|uniref:Serine/threonine-protein phosphatase n=1 Tax=Flammeovirga agarivorans TaxID=2726742 RepID=A0A7X8SQM1_9BACT|nr:protein phosphatase 2C domain-containing protein [Flammeovirga agarivorans]NLR94447.1 serine/threonine-protein phosphatase [Flammeovirga agarivorans]
MSFQKLNIFTPLGLHELGKRKNNEDYLYPTLDDVSLDNRVFLVCDGVGGHERGEVASEIVAKSFAELILKNYSEGADEEGVAIVFEKVQGLIDKYLEENPEAKGMGTTMTFLQLHKKGATVAHCGDSRVYLIRNGKIIWKTNDHSYVNELLQRGLITEEEAIDHPKKNVISRAVMGKSMKEVVPDVALFNDLEPYDVFFMCSDGILESMTDNGLEYLFSSQMTDLERIQKIKETCAETSKDNHTCFLIRLNEVEKEEEVSDESYEGKGLLSRLFERIF